MASIGSRVRAACRARAHRLGDRQRAARRARRPLCDQFVCRRMALARRARADRGRMARSRRAARSSPTSSTNPAFALAAAPVFGNDVGAVLVWSGTQPRQLLGFFPARIGERRYGIKLPILVGWTHPYAPLGTPLVERDAAEPVIAAWLAHIAGDPSLPGLVLLPLLRRGWSVRRGARRDSAAHANAVRRFCAASSGACWSRATTARTTSNMRLSAHRQRELRRSGRRLADARRVAVHGRVGAVGHRRRDRGFFRARSERLEGQSRHRRGAS